MLGTAHSFILDGISARPVRVEVDVHRGLPGFTVVGLPESAVRETRERVRAALVNCGFEFPLRRIVVNLAPASLRKAGPGLDLPIVAALLRASGQMGWEGARDVALVGELALDGTTRPVQGALAMAEAAREAGATAIVVPEENAPEAALAEGIEVIALDSPKRLPALAEGEWNPRRPQPHPVQLDPAPGAPDLADLYVLDDSEATRIDRAKGLKVGERVAIGPAAKPKVLVNAHGTAIAIDGKKVEVEIDAGDRDRLERATGEAVRESETFHIGFLEKLD